MIQAPLFHLLQAQKYYYSVLDLLEIIPYEDYALDNFEGGEIEFMFTENYGDE